VATGRIIEWVRQIGRDGWACVIIADEPVNGPPWQGRHAFDPKSIHARDTDQLPADLAQPLSHDTHSVAAQSSSRMPGHVIIA
jgi:hypothetical protein